MDETMKKRVIKAMRLTWQQIAEDVADMEGGAVDAEIVREMVVDAYRLRTYGQDSDAADAFYALTHRQMRAVVKEAFPEESY